MKKSLLTLSLLFLVALLNAQVTKSLNVTAGNLASSLSTDELQNITSLTLNGTIDARDFKTMRDSMPVLAELDLSNTSIVAYSGTEGTMWPNIYTYNNNTVPRYAFYGYHNGLRNMSLTSVILPSETSLIDYRAFYRCQALSSVQMPSTVVSIDNYVFQACNNLTTINLSESLNNIGYYAFQGCSSLSSIDIPASVNTISNRAFAYCNADINVDPNNQDYSSLNGILYDKVQSVLIVCPLSKAGDLVIPPSVKTIKEAAFEGCNQLTSMHIPNNTNVIQYASFWGCSGLTSIFVDDIEPIDLSNYNNVFNFDKTNCTLYVPFGSASKYASANQWMDFQNIIEIPGIYPSEATVGFGPDAGSKAIYVASSAAWTASSDQSWLTLNPTSSNTSDSLRFTVTANTGSSPRTATITISATGLPDQQISVTQYNPVELTAGGLKNLLSDQLNTITSLTLYGTIDARDFKTMRDEMPLLSHLDLSNVTIVEYKGTEGPSLWGNNFYPANETPEAAFTFDDWNLVHPLEYIQLPNNVTRIGSLSFRNCNNLYRIDFSSSCLSIGNEAFSGCQKLTALQLPYNLERIESNAFSSCQNLSNVDLPSSLIEIGYNAFAWCNKLKSIDIPASANIIQNQAFAYSPTEVNVDVANPNYSSLNGVLYNKDQSTLINGPNTLADGFIVPPTVTSIYDYAFAGCNNLSSLIIPDNVSSLGYGVFQECFNLSTIQLPSQLNKISRDLFQNCSNLSAISIPNSVTSIEDNAFRYCRTLTSITIPGSVNSIGYGAFYACSGLTEIYIEDCEPIDLTYSNDVFTKVDLVKCILKVPFGSAPKYVLANQWMDFQNIVETPGIFPSEKTISFGPFASSKAIFVASSATWTTSSDQSWLTINPTSSSTSDSLRLTVAANTSTSPRKATVTISASGLPDQQISVTQYNPVEVTAGGLKNLLGNQLNTITSLTLTGTIDARDFKTMRDEMPLLSHLDLSNVTIVEYQGTEGTSLWGNNFYPANETPEAAFTFNDWNQVHPLEYIQLPNNLIRIGDLSFRNCNNLNRIDFPSSCLSIGNEAFSGCQKLTALQLPNNLERIESNAFSSCQNLSNVDLPSSLIEIGYSAFAWCNKLKSIDIPVSVTLIQSRAFGNSPTEVNVDEANLNYSSLNGVLYNKDQSTLMNGPSTLPDGFVIPLTVTSIYDYAFAGCNMLTTLIIPDHVKSIGDGAFESCYQLTSIQLPNYLAKLNRNIFSDCNNLTTVDIPSSIVSIEDYAFSWCQNLTSITIPASVKSIKYAAFYYCTGLTSINVENTEPIDLSSSNNVFYYVNKTNCTLYVPFGSTLKYASANQWMDFQNIVETPGIFPSVTNIGFGVNAASKTIFVASSAVWTASSDQSWLTLTPTSSSTSDSITFIVNDNTESTPRTALVTLSAEGYDDIQINVTQYNGIDVTAGGLKDLLGDQLASITSLTLTGTIDARDFKTMRDEMPLLAELDLTNTTIVAYIGTEGTAPWRNDYIADELPENAFWNYNTGESKTSLTSILFPINLKRIGDSSFPRCHNLSTIQIPSGVYNIGSDAFLDCNGLTKVIVPASVRIISSNAFNSCDNLISINLPEGLESIRSGAFAYCSLLDTIRIPSTVIEIYDNPFQNTQSPIIVNENNILFSSLEGVLYNKRKSKLIHCPNSVVDKLVFPESVTEIGNNAFFGCTNIVTLVIPNTVNKIGYNAFHSCSQLKEIQLSESLTTLSGHVLAYCNSLEKMHIPNSVTNIEGYAFRGSTSISELYIPESVTFIGERAFEYCSGLTSIYIMNTDPVNLSNSNFVFQYVDKINCTIYVPYGSATKYSNANQWQEFQNIVEMDGFYLSDNSLLFGANSETQNMIVFSNTSWSLSSAADWLSVTPISGTNDTQVGISAVQNFGEKRFATITVSSPGVADQNLKIEQMSGLEVGKSLVNFIYEGGTQNVDIYSNTTWSATVNQGWVNISPNSGTNNGTLTIVVEENDGNNSRTALVTVSAPGLASKTIKVQQGAPMFVARYTPKLPVVDGIIDEVNDPWGDFEFTSINQNSFSTTTFDMQSKFQLLVGNEALYVAVLVRDNTPHNEATISNSWERDCNELFISMDTLTNPDGSYKEGCIQIRTQRSDASGVSLVDGTSNVNLLLNDPLFQVSSLSSDTGYVQELILPFSALTEGMDPEWDQSFIRFDIQTADNTTGAGGGRTQNTFWNDNSDQQWQDTRVFGVVQLEQKPAQQNVVANFSIDANSSYTGEAPHTVQFLDKSLGSPTSWNWNFGDGTSSTEQSPSHTYQSVGTYTVSLTASNAISSDIEVKTDYITVTQPASCDPEWQVVSYTNNTTAYCIVTIDGEPATANDKIAAFVGNECRGIGDIVINNNEAFATMLIQGEAIETVSFKVWDASECTEFDACYSTQTNPGANIGYPPNFLPVNVCFDVSQQVTLNAGWNLVSFYADDEQQTMENIFGPSNSSILQVKSMTQSWDPAVPAFLNTLSSLQNRNVTGFFVKASNSGTVEVTGKYIGDEHNSPTLLQGWNLIGYPFDTGQEVTTAFNQLISNNQLVQIKNMTQSYDPAVPAFLNTLSTIEPGMGYFLKTSANSSDFSYPIPTVSIKSAIINSECNCNWDFKGYTESTVRYAEISLDGFAVSENDHIAAFVGNECRAISRIVKHEGNSYSTLVINGTKEEDITFKLCKDGMEYDSRNSILARPGSTNSAIVPIQFYSKKTDVDVLNITALPNPFYSNLTIRVNTTTSDPIQLQIYDVNGRLVKDIYKVNVTPGLHLIEWDAKDSKGNTCPRGLYLINLNCGKENRTTKVILNN